GGAARGTRRQVHPGPGGRVRGPPGHGHRPPGPHPGRGQLRDQRRGGPGEPPGRAQRRDRHQGRPRRQPAGQVQRPGPDRQQPAGQRRRRPGPHLHRHLPPLPVAADGLAPGQVGQHRPGRPRRVAPASFTVRAADSDDTSAVANAARAATVLRAARSSNGPKPVAASPETTIVARKNSPGTTVPDTTVIATRTTTPMDWSIMLSARTTTRSVSPPWATTSAGVCALTRRGPVCPCTRRRLIRSIWPRRTGGPHPPGTRAPVNYGTASGTSSPATPPPAGQNSPPVPSTRSAHSHGSTDPSRPSSTMTTNSTTAPSPNRASFVTSRRISRRVRAGAWAGSGGGSVFGGTVIPASPAAPGGAPSPACDGGSAFGGTVIPASPVVG